jgi:hypothetical protein
MGAPYKSGTVDSPQTFFLSSFLTKNFQFIMVQTRLLYCVT